MASAKKRLAININISAITNLSCGCLQSEFELDSNTLSWAAMNTSSIFSSSSGGQFESPVYNGVKYLE